MTTLSNFRIKKFRFQSHTEIETWKSMRSVCNMFFNLQEIVGLLVFVDFHHQFCQNFCLSSFVFVSMHQFLQLFVTNEQNIWQDHNSKEIWSVDEYHDMNLPALLRLRSKCVENFSSHVNVMLQHPQCPHYF